MSTMSDKFNDAVAALNKKHGDSTMVNPSGDSRFVVESFPTGLLSLDHVFGCGGLPKGRVIEIHGAPSSTKTSLATYLVSQVQKAGGRCVWVDAEACFDNKYATAMGVDINKLIVSQPECGEDALDIVHQMVEAGADLIVVDSVSALVPKKELEGEIEDQQVALQARMLSKGLRMITASLAKSDTTIIFINQLREIVNSFGFGPKKTTSGGQALRFYASVRLEVTRVKTLKDKDGQKVGNDIKIEAVKNKCGIPFRSIELEFIYGKGFDLVGELVTLGTDLGVITKSGNTYSYEDKKLGVGISETKEALEADPELKEKLTKAIVSKSKE